MQYNHAHETFPEKPAAGLLTPQNDNIESNNRDSGLFTAVIKAKESQAEMWTETVQVISASQGGAGFYIKRECHAGQLVSLLMPMPANLRRYDTDKKLYKVWGLVQHCSKLTVPNGFQVGVAFVGSTAPGSYYDKPLTSYRVCGVGKDGFWKIDETDTPFSPRKHARFPKSLDVSLFVLNDENVAVADEKTVTENISENGASVFSRLEVDAGDRIRFYCCEFKFTAIALVRNRKFSESERPRLHLEFIENIFPISEISGSVARK